MNSRTLLGRLLAAAILLAGTAWLDRDALAQDYGVGETIIVPQAPQIIPIDGVYEADIWDTGATFNLLAQQIFWSEEFPADVTLAEGKALFKQDTLFIFVTIEETELFFHEEGYAGDHILIGIDPVHEAGVTDQLVDQDDWAGWPENAPDAGPYALTIQGGSNAGIKLWWGFAETDPVEEGWVRGEVWEDAENNTWGVEAAIYVPTVEAGAEVGFNIGGGTASQASADALGAEEAVYGYFSLWSTENPGGDIQSRTDSYGTLRMAGGGEGYGGGFTFQVPRVEPGSITIDGVDDEAAWADAQSDIDVTAHWSSYGPVGETTPEPDLFGETKLLWSDDTLYVHHRLFDPLLFFQEEDPWGSDMILIGIDNSHEGDSLFGPNYDGGIGNAPEGVYTYFINPITGFTFAWNDSIAQHNPGLVNAVIYVDEESGEWGLEAAIHVPAIEMGAQIGFDIGGAQASPDQCGEGYCDYAYFAWQSGAEGTDPGAINRDASYWATLMMVEEIDTDIDRIDEVPQRVSLYQNYPNPFNPTTTIEFELDRAAMVQLDVFNVLGQKIQSLVNEPQAAGIYRYTWDAANLSSGMYVYQLRVDGQLVGTRKMMLIK